MGIHVNELLEYSSPHFEAETSVSGILLVKGDGQAFLVAKCTDLERGRFVTVVEPTILKIVDSLPPYGGGNCLYCAEATITGFLGKGPEGLVLRSVSRVQAACEGFRVDCDLTHHS